MFNLFLSISTSIFNDVSQPWQVGFQTDAFTIFCFSVLCVLSCIVIFSCNETYSVKYAKLIHMTSNVLICIGIFCFFLLVYACVGDDPIFCAGPTPEELEAMKIKTKAQSQNLQTAMTAWVGFITAFSGIVIKAKMKPVLKGGFWSAGMSTGTGFSYGMYKTANADVLSTMNSSTFHSPASSASASPVTTTPASTATTTPVTTTPASTATTATTTEASPATTTPLSSNGDSTQSLDQQPYNIHSPVEEEKSSLIWDLFIKILPEWIKEDIASRLPSCSNTGTYHILFMQYNIFVYLMSAAFLFFWFFVALTYILTWIKNNREYFIEKVLPTFLSKLVPSKSVLGAMITVNKASLMLYVMAFGFALCFLYANPLPADLGMVCDKAVSLAIPLVKLL